MDPLYEAVQLLIRRVDALEHRVAALEPVHASAPTPVTPPPPVLAAGIAQPVASEQVGIFSVLGKAMLAVAGAYLLRALAESTALPHIPVMALAILYAFFWLVPAAKGKSRLSSVAWACTSALILLPMLWELTLRFALLPVVAAAAILGAFTLAAALLSWRQHFAEVVSVAAGAGSLAAVALALAAHNLVPFLAALLVMNIVGEIAAATRRTFYAQAVLAAAADLALFALIWIYSSPAAARAEYPGVSAAVLLVFAPLLLFVDAGSASVQTLLQGRRISWFETTQTLLAFLLAVWGVLAFWSGPAARILGVLCLIAAAPGYVVSFSKFANAPAQRNFHVYASGSLALLLAGFWLSLPGVWLALSLTLVAVMTTVAGVRTNRRTLQFHGFAFLFAAALSSELFRWAGRSLAGPFPASPDWIFAVVSVAAMFSYAAVARNRDDRRPLRLLRLLLAALALGTVAALLIWGLVRLTVGIVPGAEHLAVMRTVSGCALSMLLAWSGSRQQHRELVWLAWTLLACLAGKLLFEDLRHGHLGFTAASIFVYAVTLLAVPRLARLRQTVVHDG